MKITFVRTIYRYLLVNSAQIIMIQVKRMKNIPATFLSSRQVESIADNYYISFSP